MRQRGRALVVWLGLLSVAALTGFTHSVYAERSYSPPAKVIRLAERGNAKAQVRLGWMYSVGRGVPQNYLQAANWYRRAAEQGEVAAQFALGLLYNKGHGVPKDLVLAHMWLNLAASRAVGEDRDFIVNLRDAIASKLTSAQLEAAQQLARAWQISK